MNRMHEANRKLWDEGLAREFQKQDEASGAWRKCVSDPDGAFDSDLLSLMREFIDDFSGKDVCIFGSGDNHSAFALAGLGANVTSVDQSAQQLEVAAGRAAELGMDIDFVRTDATDLAKLQPSDYEVVCSTNGFFVWISDLDALYSGIARILRPGGLYFFLDIHPFQRPWKDAQDRIEMEKPYLETAPIQESDDGSCYFYWTMGDLLNALADSGFCLRRVRERGAKDSSYWQTGKWYEPGDDASLLDWKVNPRAGLPCWLQVAAQKIGQL